MRGALSTVQGVTADRTASIEGVPVSSLRRFPDERGGTIFHMLRADDPHFVEFGEIYFARVYTGVVKAGTSITR
jgi:dTDP-4-dehydrorhamnose 3,5-epimerase